MADVTKVGPQPQDPLRGPREPTKPGTDKFKDLMKVDKSGDQQKKRKKRQEEAEEDTKAALRSGAVTPDKAVEGTKKVEKFPKIQKIGESEKKQPQQQKRAEEAAALDEIAAATANRQKIENINLDEVPSPQLETTGKPSNYAGEIQKQEAEEEVAALQEKEEGEKITIKKHIKKESTTQPSAQVTLPAATTLGPSFIAPASTIAPVYMQLNSEMLALFEKMVSLLTVMQVKGDSETTIHLNTPEFSSSVFAGAQITIKEFSTAPYVYNIEFLGTSQNTTLFEANSSSLRAAFESEKRNYSINRIETRLQKAEKPLFHRKGKVSDQKEK